MLTVDDDDEIVVVATDGVVIRTGVGSIRIGETVKIAYVDQSRDSLDDKKTVWAEISGGLIDLPPASTQTSPFGARTISNGIVRFIASTSAW